MTESFQATVITALAAGDATRPLLTYYDDATGERTELSRATMGNWVAKTANLLVDGLGLGPGDIAAIRLPAHWQTAAVALGCWAAGLAIDFGTPAASAPADRPAVAGRTATVAFVTADAHPVDADEVFALALAPLAMPFRPGPPPGTIDYVIEVRPHGDHFTPARPLRPDHVALADATTHADLATLAARRGIAAGSRLLIDGDDVADPIEWLVSPLLSGASIVLCRNVDQSRVAARLTSEYATRYP